MSFTVFTALLSYALISSFTPGPGNILALNTITNYGWKMGKKLFTGICFGYFCVQLVCMIGVYGLSRHLEQALHWFTYIGTAYLVWLAFHILFSEPEFAETQKEPSFWTGFLLQFVNVKIYFYIITVLSGYVYPYYPSIFAMLIAGLFLTAIGCFATFTWAQLGVALKTTYRQHYRIINIIFSGFLLFCAWNMLTH